MSDMRDEPGDDELEARLRWLAASREPVPADLAAAAAGALAWRDPDAALAELIFDSLLDQDAVTLARGGPERLLSFRGGARSVDLEVTVAGPARTLIGQVTPPGPAAVSIRHAGGTVRADADDLGRFRAEGVPPGPVSLRLHEAAEPDGTGLVTDWVSI